MEKFVKKFLAYDANGNSIEIWEYATILDANTFDGKSQREGLHRLQTSEGEYVNRLSDGDYQIVGDLNIYYEK